HNLQRVVPRLLFWTYGKNEGYRNLNHIYTGLVTQFDYYVEHTLSYFGGTYETNKSAEQPGPVYEPVPVNLQLEAMDFVTRHVFSTPRWLLDSAVLARTGQSPVQIVGRSQETVLNSMLSINTLGKIAVAEAMYGDKVYHLSDYLDDLDAVMWTEFKNYDAITIYRRNLQRYYLDKLIELSSANNNRDIRDVSPWVRNKLADIQSRLKKAVSKTKDPVSINHLKYLEARIIESGVVMP
ncbi:MAG TPA: zinc-dependent metalloprotease, partial [Cyclobacteriaceae bacterium]